MDSFLEDLRAVFKTKSEMKSILLPVHSCGRGLDFLLYDPLLELIVLEHLHKISLDIRRGREF